MDISWILLPSTLPWKEPFLAASWSWRSYVIALLIAIVVTAWQLTQLDLRTTYLEDRRLLLLEALGFCFAWALASADGTQALGRLLLLLLTRSLIAMLPIYLIAATSAGMGGGDVRYLRSFSYWMPWSLFYGAVVLACVLHVGMVLLTRRRRRVLATAFLPALNVALVCALGIGLLE